MTTRKKAQMSLEMVIGLLILLVVAAVVIKIFLGSVTSIGSIDDLKKAHEYSDFKNQCSSLCDQFKATGGGLAGRAAAAKYCAYKFAGASSLKQDLLNKPIESDTKAGINVCPDAIYCFQAKECDTDSGPIGWDDCKNILCQAYYDSFGDYGKASQKVMQLIPNQGSCSLPSDANWFTLYGFGPNPPCGGIIGASTTTTTTTTTPASSGASVSCLVASSSSVTCNWSCPNAISQSNTGVLAVDKVNQATSLTTKVGSYTFTGLTSGTKYNVGLVCDPQTGNLVASTYITI